MTVSAWCVYVADDNEWCSVLGGLDPVSTPPLPDGVRTTQRLCDQRVVEFGAGDTGVIQPTCPRCLQIRKLKAEFMTNKTKKVTNGKY